MWTRNRSLPRGCCDKEWLIPAMAAVAGWAAFWLWLWLEKICDVCSVGLIGKWVIGNESIQWGKLSDCWNHGKVAADTYCSTCIGWLVLKLLGNSKNTKKCIRILYIDNKFVGRLTNKEIWITKILAFQANSSRWRSQCSQSRCRLQPTTRQ